MMNKFKKFLKKVYAKYPHFKVTKHSGDSYIIYEAGQRSMEDPFGKKPFDKFVKENEADSAKVEQTEDNWQGEGCEDYDDAQDVCLDDVGVDDEDEDILQDSEEDEEVKEDEADGGNSSTVSTELLNKGFPLGWPVWDYTKDSIWDYQKNVERYPRDWQFKGALNDSYPTEKDWWQKALSKYQVKVKK
jgi:hypothetical protein